MHNPITYYRNETKIVSTQCSCMSLGMQGSNQINESFLASIIDAMMKQRSTQGSI